MNFKKIKLTKTGVTGRIPEGLHPNGIEPGHVEIGYMLNPPKVGESFLLYPYNRGFFSNFPFFGTSVVTEVFSEFEFRTLNSFYRIEKL